jgi:Do/DeqQ family serine protease
MTRWVGFGAFLLLAFAAAAQAQTSRLWSERSADSAPLAAVPDFRAVAKQVLPCVVAIAVEQRVANKDQREFFHDLFRGEMPREYKNRGLGSGFTIRRDGLILTNHHVIEEASSIQVSFPRPDGTEKKLNATVVGAAPHYDIALLQTSEPADAAICFLGDSAKVDIGDWVMAVGNPFGLSHSVSVGIISAKERREVTPSGRRGLYDFLQTDASINPGNSGGPLVNMQGSVIGINSAINAAGSGIGFAIPINMVKTLLPSLQQKGRYVRSWLGIKIQALTESLAQTYGLPDARGALVSEVVVGSPAESAGIREGDVVLSFDGKPVRDQTDLPLYAGMAGIGQRVVLTIWREGREHKKNVVLTAFPEDEAKKTEAAAADTPTGLGITVADITPEIQQELRLDQDSGVVLRDVDRGSAADKAGLQKGDVLLSVNGQPLRAARELAQVVKQAASGATLRLQVKRAGGKLFVALPMP